MAKERKNSKSKSQSAAVASSNDNVLWMTGFVLLILGVFALVSVLSHFVHWSSDLSALRAVPELSTVKVEYENICSGIGAHVAYWIVDCLFGVFGVIIPIVITCLGWRIFRKKPLRLNHFALSAALLLVVGSLTLGLIANKFAIRFDIGGALGQACAQDLADAIGTFGTVLVIITGWIMTGVFINHNFRKVVDNIGDGVERQGGRMKRAVEGAIINHRAGRPAQDEISEEVSDKPATEIPQPQTEPQIQPQIEPQPQVQPILEPREAAGVDAKPMTMNEYLAARREEQIGHPEFGRDKEYEDEFFVQREEPAVEPVAERELKTAVAQYDIDEDGFTVEPNVGATPNEIDVEALLERKQQENRQRMDRELDEQGFAVMPSSEPEHDEVEPMVEPMVEPRPSCEPLYDEDGIYVESAQVNEHKPKITPRRVVEEEEDGIIVTVRENKVSRVDESEIDMELYDPLRDLESYKKPYVSLLEDYRSPHKVSDAEIYDNKCRIQETLKYFGIPIVDIQATVGPTVTLYEIVQAQGVKISKVQGLEKDIAQSLRAQGIRIIAPIPGRGTIGIEVPNRDKQIVSMYSAICSEEFQNAKMELPIVIGRTIQNNNFTFDLAKLPHLLVAGATGQGKSVGLNAIITSLLYTKHPSQLKFVMIDPKMVEFSVYNKLERHFLAKMESEDEPIVTDPKKAVYVLNSLVEEMGRRLELCKMATARNIVEYNEKFTARRLNPNKGHRFLPYIVVIVDEFADLIMTAKEVEVPVMRLAQKARAVGIHLIIATQRPDVKVITGGIKANFPARIAFRVMQMIDSRTIIDQPGANQLIGRGDMLFSKDGELTRIQCALVETKEVERLVDYISKQQGYTEAYQLPDYVPDAGGEGGAMSDGDSGAPVKYDVLFGEVARAAVTTGVISTSSIQRNYEVGFNRAGRIMMQLERAGIVGPQVGQKPREIRYYDLPSLEAKLQDLGVF